MLDMCASVIPNRELDTVLFQLATEGDRLHGGGVLVQQIDLLEGQTLGLKNETRKLPGDQWHQQKRD